MSEPSEQTAAEFQAREEFRRDLDAFEALERQLLSDERRERARKLAERFAGLKLTIT
ncbi:hypothetical protein LPW26_14505 [Rhodopseudomonas sp. HC1]|uniref:hypothetical protein n=1 Tax=Rhodopseudomonas infernalis TaxID=2897386 RepID=UPI001EE9A68F|nr:hypothetical protein [Rhodopseudomonas infernalis]MCG6205859.1 hypothetical protein [Rhodopseudomonas infernalis]